MCIRDRLIGIITVDDAIDVIREENTEDFEKMAAMMPSDESYFKTSAFTHAKNRIMWLLFLMLSATMTQAVITHYEAAFATVPLLVAFIPMITGTGGNCGSQSSTMIIRGLALDEIEPKDVFKAMLKDCLLYTSKEAVEDNICMYSIVCWYYRTPSSRNHECVQSIGYDIKRGN